MKIYKCAMASSLGAGDAIKLKFIMTKSPRLNPGVKFQSGKSTISNFLSEAIDFTNTEYRPTPGVRILEFEFNAKGTNVEIELWDCSGDLKYESYWPVFLWKAHGVIIVYNPDDKEQLAELQRFHEHFVVSSVIPKNSCLILGHAKDPDYNKNFQPDLSGEIANIKHENVNVLEDSDRMKIVFGRYISSVISEATDFDRDDISLIAMPV